jgi:hypothetical protein
MAEYYMKTGRLEKAKESLDGSLYLCSKFVRNLNHRLYPSLNRKLEDEIYLKSYMEKIHRLYSDVYSALNDDNHAFEHFKLASQWEDSIYNQQNRRQWAMLQGQYETERAQSKITVLETENEMKNMEIRQSRIYLFVMGGFVVMIAFMALLFIRQNKMRADQKSIELEHKLFRLQMNPHFIFNALSGILHLINKEDIKNAGHYLTSFSHLLRSTLKSSREDYILLEEELESMRNYLNLQSLLYMDKLTYSIEVDEAIDLEDAIIPPMLIQPFVENAVVHGIKHKEGKGNVSLSFKLENKTLICEVEDDGVGRKKSSEIKSKIGKKHQSMATDIIQDRIQTLNKKLKQRIKLEIIDKLSETSESLGTRVVLRLPYLLD